MNAISQLRTAAGTARRGLLATAAALAAACTEPVTGPSASAGPPTALVIEGGQDQTAVAGDELPAVLTVRIVDAQQRPVRGYPVAFRVTSGGGAVFVGTAVSSDSGIVRDRWTLGTSTRSQQRLEVRAVDPTGRALVAEYRATATPGTPASIAKVQGDGQAAVAGEAASDSLVARVEDRFGNPVPDVTVRWSVVQGGGGVSSDSVRTDASGIARTQWTVGRQVGATQQVTATFPGIGPAVFSATVRSAAPAVIELVEAAADAPSGAPFGIAPRLRIIDAFGNLVTDASGHVELVPGDGLSVVGPANTPVVNGVAQFSSTGVRGRVGEYRLTYRMEGLSTASQQIVVSPGAPARLALITAPDAAVSGSPFAQQPVLGVQDDAGNLTASSATVVANLDGGAAALLGAQAAQASAGVARFENLRIDAAATHTLRFSIDGTGIAQATATITVLPGPAQQLVLSTLAGGATGGRPFAVQPVLEVRDAFGNRTTSQSVAVSLSASAGVSVLGSTTATSVDGRAAYADVGLDGAGGVVTLTFSAPGLAPAIQRFVLGSPRPLSAGTLHTCALDVTGQAYCWGDNRVPQLGGNTFDQQPTPVGGGHVFGQIAVGDFHSCGVDTEGLVLCWGGGGEGQLGDGTLSNRVLPTMVSGNLRFARLAAGAFYTCGLTLIGEAYCWGENSSGMLGDGTPNRKSSPTRVLGGLRFTRIAPGRIHTCALAIDSVAYCWGDGSLGRLGSGDESHTREPRAVAGTRRFVELVAGIEHTCGLAADGAAFCWGSNGAGQLGDGTNTLRLQPQAVSGGLTFTSLSAGRFHTCGLTAAGVAYCWGSNGAGELGDGTTISRTVPTAVAGSQRFARLTTGGHTCGVTERGDVFCWGENQWGQLGDFTRENRVTPTAVPHGRGYAVP